MGSGHTLTAGKGPKRYGGYIYRRKVAVPRKYISQSSQKMAACAVLDKKVCREH